MKSNILLSVIILCCVTFVSSAQINPGKILLGGSIGYSSNKNTQPGQPATYADFESLYSSIQIGKFIKENTAVGATFSYGHTKTSTQSNPDNNTAQFNAGVFYRKYKTLYRNFYFFGEGDASYAYSKSKFVYYQSSTTTTNMISNGGTLSFIPGISYNVWKKMQVELLMPNILSIGYSHIKTDYAYTNPSSSSSNEGHIFSANANLNSNFLANFGIGFKFFL